METLEEEYTATDDQQGRKAMVLFPDEIIEDILFRLPVKSILRFRSVSKPWLSLISHPSFTKLHFTRSTAANRTALFMTAYDTSTKEQYLFSAACEGGPLTHLITLDGPCLMHEAKYLNGLICFTCTKGPNEDYRDHVFIVNPSTHKIFKVPDPYPYGLCYVPYLFGYDESRNEFKIMMIRELDRPIRMEVMIFSLSTYSWRKVDVQPPVGCSCDVLFYGFHNSVCVDSVVHVVLHGSFDILAFDLRTEKFSIINPPQGVLTDDGNVYQWAFLIKINGCIGLVSGDWVEENNTKMPIWILQDYKNRVWVREFVTFPQPWFELDFPYPVDSVNMDEIIFSPSKFFSNVKSVTVYNRKRGSFKSLQFTFGHQFPLSKTLEFDKIRCYVESMVLL